MGKATSKATIGEWQMVNRKKGNSSPATAAATIKPLTLKPYSPQSSYADVVRTGSPHKPSHPSKNPPLTQTKPQNSEYYVSPHSDAQLRFPPSPHYTKWKGRCVRCCRMGHSASFCKNLRRCGRCWGQSHIGSFCKSKPATVAAPLPKSATVSAPLPKPAIRSNEPSFDDIFLDSLPPMDLPTDRPEKIVCFIERDDEYFKERAKLNNVVVMSNPALEVDLSIEEVAEYAATSGLVQPHEISVGIMTRSRYAILLPMNVDPVHFIKSIPLRVWSQGYFFSLWCPIDDATVVMPCYKVMLDLIGIPMDLYRERNVIRAASAIGTYLGTVEQGVAGDVACWTIVVATTSLSLIPHQVAYRVGALEFLVDVISRRCVQGAVYKTDEIPQPRGKFSPPLPKLSAIVHPQREDDQFIGSRKILEELCQRIEFESLPIGIQAVLKGASSMVQNQEEDDATPRLQMQVTENPVAEFLTADNQAANPEITSDLGTNNHDDLSLTVEEIPYDEMENVFIDPISRACVDKSVLGIFITEQESNSPGISQTRPNNSFINVPVQAVSITAVSPKGKETLHNKEGTNFQPRILQRNKGKGKAGCTLVDEANKEAGQIAQGPKNPPEHTRLEKKRLLQAATKNRRKIRAQAQLKSKASSSNTNKSKANLVNDEGLVEIQVDFEHCSRIAEATGFQTDQVLKALEEDNSQRTQIQLLAEPTYQHSDEEAVLYDSLTEEEDDSESE